MKTTINNYLKVMYILEMKNSKIRVTDVAEYLNYTKSSVSKVLSKLVKLELIEYEVYKNIVLLPKAREIAIEMIRKENLLEIFFVGVLNVSKEQAKKDISVISENFSDESKDKLKKYIIGAMHLNNSNCMCNHMGDKCKGCEAKKAQDRVKSNDDWLEMLKEEL